MRTAEGRHEVRCKILVVQTHGGSPVEAADQCNDVTALMILNRCRCGPQWAAAQAMRVHRAPEHTAHMIAE